MTTGAKIDFLSWPINYCYDHKSAAWQLCISVSFLRYAVTQDSSAPMIMGPGLDSVQHSAVAGMVGNKHHGVEYLRRYSQVS
jgi:hypothetical protein